MVYMMKTLLYSMSILLALNVNAAQIPIAIPRFTHAKTNNDICIEKDITQVDVNNILGIDVSNFYKLGQMCQKVKGIIYNAKQSKENDTTIAYISSGINSEESQNAGNTQGPIEEDVNNGLININTATQTELETLDGIGPSTAKKIIDYREENGKFNSIEDIQNVSGIGDAKYAAIKNDICV